MSAIRKSQEEIECIIADARAKAEPYIQFMHKMSMYSIPCITLPLVPFADLKVEWPHEKSEAFVLAKEMVASIYESAHKEVNG